MNSQIFLSLVVPCYLQEKTISKNLRKLTKTVSDLNIPYEIIVVVDGMNDKTYAIAKKQQSRHVKVLGYEKNQGKGFAVKYGMLRAEGRVIGFIDAGMDIAPEGIAMLLNHMDWYKADIIVGSKLHPVSRVNYPLSRWILSWGYRNFTHMLFGFKVRDTQVGIKIFKRNVVKKVFPLLLVKKFAFDIEMLAVSYAFGFTKIYEAPVRLDFNVNSTITSKNFWKTIFFMMVDTLAVFYRIKITRYYKKIGK